MNSYKWDEILQFKEFYLLVICCRKLTDMKHILKISSAIVTKQVLDDQKVTVSCLKNNKFAEKSLKCVSNEP